MIKQAQVGPTTERQRHVILDALRGLALMGIALANFPEFGLWTFLSSEEQTSMPTANVDETVRFLQYLLVDGKFYTIFSLLFGIGFSLILARHGRRLFVRRMLILVCIGFLHLMFILGYLAGKHHLYAQLQELPLKRLFWPLLLIALPLSLLYAWSAVGGHPWGRTVHSLLYAVSVIPMAAVYIVGVCLVYLSCPEAPAFRWLAAPGRMALTNYISQSLIGIVLFYGLGFGLGTSFGLIYIELTALAIFLIQVMLSLIWLHYFRFGPLEWLWRMCTYGQYFKIVKNVES